MRWTRDRNKVLCAALDCKINNGSLWDRLDESLIEIAEDVIVDLEEHLCDRDSDKERIAYAAFMSLIYDDDEAWEGLPDDRAVMAENLLEDLMDEFENEFEVMGGDDDDDQSDGNWSSASTR